MKQLKFTLRELILLIAWISTMLAWLTDKSLQYAWIFG